MLIITKWGKNFNIFVRLAQEIAETKIVLTLLTSLFLLFQSLFEIYLAFFHHKEKQ